MSLIVLTVLVIAFFIAVLAIYLFAIGAVLSRTAGNLNGCLQDMRVIIGQVNVIGPGVKRINKAGAGLVDALPLLVDGADQVAAKSASPATPPASSATTPENLATSNPDDTPTGVGYMDV